MKEKKKRKKKRKRKEKRKLHTVECCVVRAQGLTANEKKKEKTEKKATHRGIFVLKDTRPDSRQQGTSASQAVSTCNGAY